jgi:hypothetical protein
MIAISIIITTGQIVYHLSMSPPAKRDLENMGILNTAVGDKFFTVKSSESQ